MREFNFRSQILSEISNHLMMGEQDSLSKLNCTRWKPVLTYLGWALGVADTPKALKKWANENNLYIVTKLTDEELFHLFKIVHRRFHACM